MSQRRAVCKSWFNAKWRDLILAFGAFLSDGDSEFTLPTGKTGGILIAAKPMSFDAPISLMLEEDKVAIETAEGDVDDFDGVERENDPAFFVPDELEADPKDQDGADGGDS